MTMIEKKTRRPGANGKKADVKYPGIPVTTNGNQLVAYYTEARIAEAGVFYPITPSTEMGENYQLSFARGELTVFGESKIALEAEGEHAAQGGAIAASVTGKRVVSFTSGQGIVYGLEQYYHAPGKLATMVVQVAARALTKHALNVHCGHDDVYAVLDSGWIVLFAKDAQQAADQSLILRKVTELSLNPGINAQDGFLTSHLERTSKMLESELIREFLGRSDDLIKCPTEAQKTLFGPMRRRVPKMFDLENPMLLGPVQNQEHYMNGIAARRNNFSEPIIGFLEDAYEEFGNLTGRHYGLISQYNCEDAETVFVSLGSSAENIEAAVDYLEKTRGEKVGVIHVNVIRPFPEVAIINALKGKKRVIVLERTDESVAGANPLTRDIRTALSMAADNDKENAHDGLPAISPDQMPLVFSGVYGLGSRDFRPEGIIGAYDFTMGRIARKDGKKASDGVAFFFVGIDHPYAVISEETPSLLPDNVIAIRFHSIGGWGMITTGKNLGEILGAMGEYIKNRGDDDYELHISANPKYGSEKKGAPTSYFLSLSASEPIRVNCDLRHVDVVLSADPKIFTHSNPLAGIQSGGAFVWEFDGDTNHAWERIPGWARKQIIEKDIQVYLLPGFDIAKKATDREELQLRMQGNAFLGAFFKVSTFLQDNKIPDSEFHELVEAQYKKKFGRFGDDVVASNMDVMISGYERVTSLTRGDLNAPDHSSMRGESLDVLNGKAAFGTVAGKAPIQTAKLFDDEFSAGLGYDQPASVLASVGMMAAGTGSTASKYGARRQVPVFNPSNCTQCMACITACPDTALPNTAQDIGLVLNTAFRSYVKDSAVLAKLTESLDDIESKARSKMNALMDEKNFDVPFATVVIDILAEMEQVDSSLNHGALDVLKTMLPELPFAYSRVNALYKVMEKKEAGSGGLFSIFVSDLCKGCGECVTECGDHDALRMVDETEDINGIHTSAFNFLDQLPNTPAKYLGKFDPDNPQDSISASLMNHLMIRDHYEALVSGDGACAGCGEKSILRGLATITEAVMRPRFAAKAERLDAKAARLEKEGSATIAKWKKNNADAYKILARSVAHLVMGNGFESGKMVDDYLDENPLSDKDLVNALISVLRQDAYNHRDLQTLDGRLANGMATMAMAANTGCNTVYGSTPPNNPHPYPWMNSLFQDGATIGWIFGETFIVDHSRRSVLPERLADHLLNGDHLTEEDYFSYTHFTDTQMTDQEIAELPKIWVVGGDGAMGDIGFQNVSKAVLQNRPNVNMILLDTQVYSNTGGQNSDSSVMTGGFDMNQIGAATQGKLTEKKSVAEILTIGHGSPYVAQISMANSSNFYKGILEGLEYRGTTFIQSFTSCQPEHGVPDFASARQAQLIRDSRGVPEFISNPALGELNSEMLSLKGNPSVKNDWYQKTIYKTRNKFSYTVAHWALTEARFRHHHKPGNEKSVKGMIKLDDIMLRITQHDVIMRRFIDKNHRAYIPDFRVYLVDYSKDGTPSIHILSRQMVLFCIERRKAWRQLQSRAGILNNDYLAQKEILADYDADKIDDKAFFGDLSSLHAEKIASL